MNEVTRYLNTMQGLEDDVRVRLLDHMANRTNNNNDSSVSNITIQPCSAPTATAHVKPLQHQHTPLPTPSPKATTPSATPPTAFSTIDINKMNDINNNQILTSTNNTQLFIQTSAQNGGNSIQLLNNVSMLPGQLGQGNVALVIPAESFTNSGQLSGYVVPVQLSNSNVCSPPPVSQQHNSNINNIVKNIKSQPNDLSLVYSGTNAGCHAPLNLSKQPIVEVTKKELSVAPLSVGHHHPISSQPSPVSPVLIKPMYGNGIDMNHTDLHVQSPAMQTQHYHQQYHSDIKVESVRPIEVRPVHETTDSVWRPF